MMLVVALAVLLTADALDLPLWVAGPFGFCLGLGVWHIRRGIEERAR